MSVKTNFGNRLSLCPRRSRAAHRPGKILVLLALLMPVLFALMGLVVDGGLLMVSNRQLQQVVDAAATSAAMELLKGNTAAGATAVAIDWIHNKNLLPDAVVQVSLPPVSAPFNGQVSCVEVIATRQLATYFIHVVGCQNPQTVTARSVAGYENSTQGAAITVLDPDPSPLALGPIPTAGLPALPTLLGGLEILGLGEAKISGAVLVNTQWGGIDEDKTAVGLRAGPPYGVSCTPLLGLTKLSASDVRVVGGVDSLSNYVNSVPGGSCPVEANRLPVPDPLLSLPAPTLASDPNNVRSTYYGGVTIVSLPLIFLPTVLQPGVYDYIQVISGSVVFQPGVYIIRSTEPIIGSALNLVAGQITANGVMFYITSTANYSPSSGLPDSADGSTTPLAPGVTTLIPSVIVNMGLLSSQFSPLADSSSPFNGIMFYQRRQDRRPILLVQQSLIGPGRLSGTVYAKWGHVLLAGMGTYNARFVAGTMRVVTLTDTFIQPTTLLPAAQDVFLMK